MASSSWTRFGAVAGIAGLFVVAAFAVANGFGTGADRVAAAQSPTPSPSSSPANTVSVTGVGHVSGTPDTLLLQLRIESRGADVSKALGSANATATKVVAALKSKGVAARDIKTSGLSVQPEYQYDKVQKLIGYIAGQSLSVKLRNLDKAGAAVSAATEAGGNDVRIDGASLDLDGDSQLIVAARANAFADAKAKAEQYAKLAGRGLGQVSSVTESISASPVPMPMPYAADVAAAKLSDVPIQRGSQEVEVRVDVIWALS